MKADHCSYAGSCQGQSQDCVHLSRLCTSSDLSGSRHTYRAIHYSLNCPSYFGVTGLHIRSYSYIILKYRPRCRNSDILINALSYPSPPVSFSYYFLTSQNNPYHPSTSPAMAAVSTEPHYKFDIVMTCGGCSGAIERTLKKLDG